MRRIGERILNAKAPTAIVLSCRSYYDGATARNRRSLSRKLRHVDLRDAAWAYIETRDLQLPGNNRLRPTPERSATAALAVRCCFCSAYRLAPQRSSSRRKKFITLFRNFSLPIL